ncbi:cyanophycinase [Mesonia ostreae]|uniref:Cyanophycinase n=1 Tax=Mesonia ostreae TaxID=861110 RepID=A0ABU2KHF8_9FLAO|nr:cyanophycinase [Mesonia ostreae]MDT0294148.1 cyanophycinase [Mesonia ostreae]
MDVKGILILIGGNEDKGIDTNERDHLEFIEKSVLARLVKECGGTNAHIVIIPTASRIPIEVAENYITGFKTLGCENISVADIRNRDDAEKEENIALVKDADCVLFSGGSQSKITHKIGGSSIHKVLLRKYRTENFVIAGTSAGAMCMSTEMITGGGGKEFFNKGAVSMGEGLGFMPDLIIDSHFIRRGRFGRLAEATARFPKLIGIGLAEDTGLIIKNCNSFETIGSGMVVIFDASELTYNDQATTHIGDPMTIAHLKTHVLANGKHFDIEKRNIHVVPITEKI